MDRPETDPSESESPALKKLWKAAFNGDVAEAQKALRMGAPIDHPAPMGAHERAMAGLPATSSGLTALLMAASQGRSAVMDFLLDQGASIEARGPMGESMLALAGRSEKKKMLVWALDAIERRAEQAPSLIASQLGADAKGCDALMAASGWASDEIIERMLSLGADATRVSSFMDSALAFAAERGSASVCRLLMRAGADPIDPRLKRTPLDRAAETTSPGLLETLTQGRAIAPEQWTRMLRVAARKKSGLVSELLRLGARDDDASKGSALRVAIRFGWTDHVKALIEHGSLQAIRAIRSQSEQDLWREAIQSHEMGIERKEAILKELARQGISLSEADSQGDFPIDLAIRSSSVKVFELMLNLGARPERDGKLHALEMLFTRQERASPPALMRPWAEAMAIRLLAASPTIPESLVALALDPSQSASGKSIDALVERCRAQRERSELESIAGQPTAAVPARPKTL